MSDFYTFSQLIYKKYKELIEAELNNYLQSNPHLLVTEEEKQDYTIQEIFTEIKPTVFSTKSLMNPFSEFKLGYYTKVYTLFINEDKSLDNVVEDIVWYQLTCSCTFEDEIDNFKILKVEPYERGLKQQSVMTDKLVPFIKSSQYEEFSINFLKEYDPDALEGNPVDINKIVSALGLQCKKTLLSKDCSIIGQISFFDTKGEIYDEESDCYVEKQFPAKTIVIDAKALEDRTVGAINNTVIHECVHWVLHRYAMQLRKINDPSSTNITCGSKFKYDINDDTSIMEAQARGIAPKILQHRKHFLVKANEFIEKNVRFTKMIMEHLFGEKEIPILYEEPIYAMEYVIEDLSEYFGVSRISAKIRLVELGFKDAKGSLIYVDGHYVPGHKSSSIHLGINETYVVSEDQFRDFLLKYDFIGKLFKDKEFLFVDNCFCVNHPKFICETNDEIHLTPYARTHMDECCMVFSADFERYKEHQKNNPYLFLYRDKGCSEIPLMINGERQELLMRRGVSYKKDLEYLDIINNANNFEEAFSQLCRVKIEELDIKISGMAFDLHYEEKTFRNYRKGKIPTLEVLLSITLYLGFSSYVINTLIEKSKFKYEPDNESHKIYRHIVSTFSGYPYKNICQEIENCGALPLT